MNTKKSQVRLWAERLLLLLFAPLTVSLAANIITNIASHQATEPWLRMAAILVLLIAVFLGVLIYTSRIDEQISLVDKWLRKRRYKNPRVLIFDGTLYGEAIERPPSPLHTNRPPHDWKTYLEKFGWKKVELDSVQRMVQAPIPDIVINPFGEIYLEENLISYATANEIREYVKNGGVYVNVAGNPFWYCYDPRIGANERTAGRMERQDGDPNQFQWLPLLNVLFPSLRTEGDTKHIDCMQTSEEIQRFGNIVNAGRTARVTIFRAYPSNTSAQMIPLLRDEEQKFYIIGSILFGKGCFLFAGVHINEETDSFDKVIAAIKGWATYEARNRNP